MLLPRLQVYFDKALYQCLLYRPERQQAQQVGSPDTTRSNH
jgi:hypothetical protein